MPDQDIEAAGGSEIESLELDSTGVVRLVWARGVSIDGPGAQLAMDRVNALCRGRQLPLLIDMATTNSVSRPARAVFSKRCDASAIALLGASPVDRVLANFFLGVHAAPVPTKFFTSQDAAVKWLMSQADAPG